MSDAERPNRNEEVPLEEQVRGPSLTLLFSLLALALLAAIGVAVLIVLPFYLRR